MSLSDFVKRECLLVFVLACLCQDLLVLVVPDQFGVSELFKVAVVFPELEIVALSLEASDFIEDA